MATKINKTNAARFLDTLHISYELVPYIVDENDLGAEHIAHQLHEPIEQVFKTLVLRGDKIGIFICAIPGNLEVDLKLAAKLSGNKNCDMIALKELQPLTGYIRGGCSPLAMKKKYPVYIHNSALDQQTIYVSAGIRGLQIKIAPADLIKAAEATVGEIVR